MELPALSVQLLERFGLMAELKENWDGDDAEPVVPSLIPLCKTIISLLLKDGYSEPTIGATPCGTIDLVWDHLGVHCVVSPPLPGLTIICIKGDSVGCEDYPYTDQATAEVELAGIIKVKLEQAVTYLGGQN